MEKMHKEMRKASRQLDDAGAREILEQGIYGVLSTADGDGRPYGVPVNYAVSGDSIFIHCAGTGHKLDNIAENPEVSFTVVGATRVVPENFTIKYESVIAFGTVRMMEGEEKREPLRMLIRKYSAGFIEAGEQYIEKGLKATRVMEMSIRHLTGKASR